MSDARADALHDAEPTRELEARLLEAPVKPTEIRDLLDGLSHDERVAAIRGTRRRAQRRLWDAVAGFGEVRLDDLVPPGTPELATVRHHGRNTLPAFTHFEKRFCRPRAGADELWGFNFQKLEAVTGPGYFVARNDSDAPEVLIDYTRIPSEAPPSWPALRGNEGIPARFVYGFMVDTLRRVSEHVTIGSAARKGRDMGSWFLLCRED